VSDTLRRVDVDARTLERIVPDDVAERDVTGRESLALHVARYRFAARHARPGRLLDLACGVGYGTRLVADEAAGVGLALGVDVSERALAYARERYGRPGVEFRLGDGLRFEDPEGFDTIVSLETLEHVADPQRLIDRLVSLLRPGGVLVASVPSTPTVDVNPHHLHDFSERSFRRMFARHALCEVACLRQRQPVPLRVALARREERLGDLRPDLLRWYATHPGAALRRAWSTLRHGLANRYLTVAWKAPEGR
jgi:2-polyprenyl-3-methyl-5-hydroxy-6-metoxy-1,4-benzoquinol methylase